MTATLQERRHGSPRGSTETHAHGLRTFGIAVATGVVLTMVLWLVSGPPVFPTSAPDGDAIRTLLTGSSVSDAQLIAAATAIAWLTLSYLAFTIFLRIVALVAHRLSGGARWARGALGLSNLVTIPAVRRLVDGGLAGILLVTSWMPLAVPGAAAGEAATVVTLRPVAVAETVLPASTETVHQEQPSRFIEYTVQRGDDLWGIARRFYSDGTRYVDIFEANKDRVMANGERFTDPRLIRSGWVLRLPLPAPQLVVDGDRTSYRVVRGDDLWSIAARLLGDGFRWGEVWELNRDQEMGGGWRFTDPNVIHPGWRLELPIAASAGPAPLPEHVEPEASDPPATERESAPLPEALGAHDPIADIGRDGEGSTWEWPSLPRPLVITAAGFALLGTTALFVRRLYRSGLLAMPAFQRAPSRGHQTGDAGRLVLVARAAAAALVELGFREAKLLVATETDRMLSLTIACEHGEGAAIASCERELAASLGCQVEVSQLEERRVDLRLHGDLRAAMQRGSEEAAPCALLLPAGVDGTDALVYLNLAGVGGVSVSGPDARPLLRNWLATLATTSGADEVAFRVDAATGSLIQDSLDLPHFAGLDGCSDASDLVEELQEMINERSPEESHRPVVALLDVGGPHASTVATLLRYGPAVGVFIIGVSSDEAVRPTREDFGASITAGDHHSDNVMEASDRGAGIHLAVGRDQGIALEPVVVRRDTSTRWREATASESPLAATPTEALPGTSGPGAEPGVQVEHEIEAEQPLVAADEDDEFDWRRALFEAPNPSSVSVAASAPTPTVEALEVAEQASGGAGELDQVSAASEDVALEDRFASDVTQEANRPDDAQRADDGHNLADGATDSAAPTELDQGAAAAPEESVRGEPRPTQPVPPAARSVDVTARQQALFSADEAPPRSNTIDATGPLVMVRCLGPYEVRVCGELVTSWPYEKSRELLAFLVAHGGAPVSRRLAAEALWPELDWDASLKHMLANAVSGLRATIRQRSGRPDLQPVTLAQDKYQLLYGLFHVDLDAFEGALRRAASLPDEEALDHYEHALAHYHGEYLQLEAFDWLEVHRAEYRRRFVDGATRGGQVATALGDLERASRFFQRAMDHAPADEEVARNLMRCLAALGNENGARKVYRVLAEAIQEELDDPRAAPSTETRELLAEVTAGASVD